MFLNILYHVMNLTYIYIMKKNILKIAGTDVKQRVLALIAKLQSFKEELEAIHYTKEEQEYFEKMWQVWDFFTSFDDEEAYEVFSHTKEFEEFNMFFVKQDEYFERSLDSAEAINIVTKNPTEDILDVLANNFSKNVFLQAAEEIQSLDTKDIHTLIMVGCGPMPETVISIAENTNISKIIAIDSDAEAVFVAGRVVNKLGLADRIILRSASGQDFDYSQADAIHIANFVRGKKEVLDQISKTAKGGCKVIARKAKLLSNLAYESVFPELHQRLIVKKEVQGSFYSYYIFEKFVFDDLK